MTNNRPVSHRNQIISSSVRIVGMSGKLELTKMA
nr:MAG TPA: hypothetical protein [Caudoviricetes sp.]